MMRLGRSATLLVAFYLPTHLGRDGLRRLRVGAVEKEY